jgi:hypothetical protein
MFSENVKYEWTGLNTIERLASYSLNEALKLTKKIQIEVPRERQRHLRK